MKPESPSQRCYYDVFGTTMRVDRIAGKWQLFRISAEGKSSRVSDICIPDDLHEDELVVFLDDMFHELASPASSKIEKLS